MFVFINIQHLKGSLDGRLRLVGIQPTGTDDLTVVVPGDDRLHEGIGTSTRGDGDGVVLQDGECAVQVLLICTLMFAPGFRP